MYTTELLSKLKPHPLNFQIYGDAADEELVDSMRKHGQQTPITLAADGKTIISGHRRYNAAVILADEDDDWKRVRVIIREDIDTKADMIVAIIQSNIQRDKTHEQKAREYRELKRAYAQQKKLGVNIFTPDGGNGKSRELAAKNVGVSHVTAEKALEVVDAIDEATCSGDHDRAAHLRDTLNNKSVRSAHKEISDPDTGDTRSPEKVAVDGLDGMTATLTNYRTTLAEWNQEGLGHGLFKEIMDNLDQSLMDMKKWANHLRKRLKD